MANPMPCGSCGRVPDAEFLVTYRWGGEWFGLPGTVPLCVSCFIAAADAMQTAMDESAADHPTAEVSDPGVLAEVDETEGVQPITSAGRKRRRTKSKPAEDNGQAAEQQTPAAHVDG